MNWQEILMILVPLLGMMGWIYNRIDKKFDAGFAEFKSEIREVKKDIQEIKERVIRLEGRFEERGYWESREWHKTGTEEK